MQYYVYILSNSHNTVIYTGITNDLVRRVYEHKQQLDKGSFTAQYNVEKLVYYEQTNNPEAAIAREKQIKSWNRKKKEKLRSFFKLKVKIEKFRHTKSNRIGCYLKLKLIF